MIGRKLRHFVLFTLNDTLYSALNLSHINNLYYSVDNGWQRFVVYDPNYSLSWREFRKYKRSTLDRMVSLVRMLTKWMLGYPPPPAMARMCAIETDTIWLRLQPAYYVENGQDQIDQDEIDQRTRIARLLQNIKRVFAFNVSFLLWNVVRMSKLCWDPR